MPLLGACDLDTFLNREYSRYDCNDLVLVLVGSPSENRIVYANNTRHALADAYYPGTGKGRIAVIDDFLGTGRPVIYAGGEDARGARLALRQLGERFAPPRIEAPQFRPMPAALRARPWMRRARDGAIALQSARRATAAAHLLVWTPEALREVRVETRLRHDAGSVLTGTVAHIAWSYAAIGPGGEVYPEGHEPIHPDGHPLPRATPFPGTVRAAGAPAPTAMPPPMAAMPVESAAPRYAMPGPKSESPLDVSPLAAKADGPNTQAVAHKIPTKNRTRPIILRDFMSIPPMSFII